jgi:hypothetical protein
MRSSAVRATSSSKSTLSREVDGVGAVGGRRVAEQRQADRLASPGRAAAFEHLEP